MKSFSLLKMCLGDLSSLVPPYSFALSSSMSYVIALLCGNLAAHFTDEESGVRVETVTEPGGGKATSDSLAQAEFPPHQQPAPSSFTD